MTILVRPLVMAGYAPRLYLDANVLIPSYLRAVLLELADTELADVHWGAEVLAEMRRNLQRTRFGHDANSVDRLISRMSRAFPHALVPHDERLEANFRGKTDPKDVHVAAGALALSLAVPRGQDVVLVTSNRRHLPDSAFARTKVRSAHPDQLLGALLAAEPRAADVLARMIERFRFPPVTKGSLLATLERAGCSSFAAALGEAWAHREEV